jgi:hypothetical protein
MVEAESSSVAHRLAQLLAATVRDLA